MPQVLVPVLEVIGGAVIGAGGVNAGLFIIGAASTIAAGSAIGRGVASKPGRPEPLLVEQDDQP